jgi:hypothetical protein
MFTISRLQFSLEILDAAALPRHWGSYLRGIFGAAMKSCFCDHPELKACRPCPSFADCEYPFVFKTERGAFGVELQGRPLGTQQNLPPPFVIGPPRLPKEIRAGDMIQFEFHSIGYLAEHYWYPVRAFDDAANHGRAPFRLVEVRDLLAAGRPIFDGKNLCRPVLCDIGELARRLMPFPLPTNIQVTFTSPVNIEWEKATEIDRETGLICLKDFFDLTRAVVERVSGLWQLYGTEWIGQAEFFRWRTRLLDASKEIRTTLKELHCEAETRYSGYRDEEIPVSGFTGTMQFSGDLTDFFELLLIGELVHVGQQTTNGLGRYTLLFN